MSGDTLGGRVVLISAFCREFGIGQQVQENYEVVNRAVYEISREEFEKLQVNRKRKVDDNRLTEQKRICMRDFKYEPGLCNKNTQFENENSRSEFDGPGVSSWLHETVTYDQNMLISKNGVSLDCLNGFTLISSSSGNFWEYENNELLFILQSEQAEQCENNKESSPPVSFDMLLE